MPDEIKKTKVSRKTILPYVVRMNDQINSLVEIVSEMPESGAKTSFSISVEALKKKYDKYAAASVVVQGEILNEEEKEALEAFRKAKAEEKEKASLSEIPASDEEPVKKQKKGKKN